MSFSHLANTEFIRLRDYKIWVTEVTIPSSHERAQQVAKDPVAAADFCKHVAYYSPPNVHIYSLLTEQPCCSVMSLLV